jgi:hypothetical protein
VLRCACCAVLVTRLDLTAISGFFLELPAEGSRYTRDPHETLSCLFVFL